MRNKKIEQLKVNMSDLMSSSELLIDYFNDEADGILFDMKKTIPSTDLSLSDIITRISVVSESIDSFEKSTNLIMVPSSRLDQLMQASQEVQARLDELLSRSQQVVKSAGGFSSFNYENFHMQTANGQNHDLRGLFRSLVGSTDSLLEAFYGVLAIIKPSKPTYKFYRISGALSGLVENISNDLQELSNKLANLKNISQRAESELAKSEEAAKEALRNKEEIIQDRTTVKEYHAEVTESKASIEDIYTKARSLEKEVKGYAEKYEEFDRNLDERNKQFDEGSKRQEKLLEALDRHNEDILDTVKRSKEMLKGATVAGLASSFLEAQRKLERQLIWARMSFYAGIIFLFISAVPLMVYVFMPIIVPILQYMYPDLVDFSSLYLAQEELTGWQYLGQVLARFIILLPAAWFVSFSAIRHSSLFRLREHYSYKYSMAVSVEGFKKQAEGYESEIAALVLEQLAFNPADKLVHSKDIKEGRFPIMSLFIDRIRNQLNKKHDTG